MSQKQQKRQSRHKRIRHKIKGTSDCPRFSVFRSNKYIYGQLIDDQNSNTLLSASDMDLKKKKITAPAGLNHKTAKAFEIGKSLAEEAIKKGIKKAVFDRGGYKYHGRVKALADGAREGGLQF